MASGPVRSTRAAPSGPDRARAHEQTPALHPPAGRVLGQGPPDRGDCPAAIAGPAGWAGCRHHGQVLRPRELRSRTTPDETATRWGWPGRRRVPPDPPCRAPTLRQRDRSASAARTRAGSTARAAQAVRQPRLNCTRICRRARARSRPQLRARSCR